MDNVEADAAVPSLFEFHVERVQYFEPLPADVICHAFVDKICVSNIKP